MNLLSHAFLLGILPVLCVFLLVFKRLQSRKIILSLFSFYFIWSLNSDSAGLMLFSILVNFWISKKMEGASEAKLKSWAFWGVLFNVALLGLHKYLGFFTDNINFLFSIDLKVPKLLLPLAISFYTIHQVSFLVDKCFGMYKGLKFLDYFNYVSFFPKLLSGPIVSYEEFSESFDSQKSRFLSKKAIGTGLALLIIGLVKKFFADHFGLLVEKGFIGSSLSLLDSWAAGVAYTLQLYFDFSGYTDIVIGIAVLLGVKLPINFNSPLKSSSIVDFWARWHRTLTQFITTYVYFPILKKLGRLSVKKAMFASFLSMIISGIWHGANWTFVLWGAMHGIALAIEHRWKKNKLRGKKAYKLPKGFAQFITLIFIILTFIVFRSENIDQVFKFFEGLLGMNAIVASIYSYFEIFVMVLALVFCLNAKNSNYYSQKLGAYFDSFSSKESFWFGLRFGFYFFVSWSMMFVFNLSFYQDGLDFEIYSKYLKKSEKIQVENDRGDYRSNLFVNKAFLQAGRKIIIAGCSQTTQMGAFRFKQGDETVYSSAIGMGGNCITNPLRTIGAIVDRLEVETIVLGLLPINAGTIQLCNPFKEQGIEQLNKLGFDFDNKAFSSLEPTGLGFLQKLKLFFVPWSDDFYQLHGFYYNMVSRIFRAQENSWETETIPLDGLRQTLIENLAEASAEASEPTSFPENGNNLKFNWEGRSILESISPGGDLYKAFENLQIILKKKGINLVVVDFPTANGPKASHIYPKGFISNYRNKVQETTASLGIIYYDLIDFFPWHEEFMWDFVHAQLDARKVLHKYISSSILEGVGSHRYKPTYSEKFGAIPFENISREAKKERSLSLNNQSGYTVDTNGKRAFLRVRVKTLKGLVKVQLIDSEGNPTSYRKFVGKSEDDFFFSIIGSYKLSFESVVSVAPETEYEVEAIEIWRE